MLLFRTVSVPSVIAVLALVADAADPLALLSTLLAELLLGGMVRRKGERFSRHACLGHPGPKTPVPACPRHSARDRPTDAALRAIHVHVEATCS